jgi:hypothetical protein
LVSATLLTLIVLPMLYVRVMRRRSEPVVAPSVSLSPEENEA